MHVGAIGIGDNQAGFLGKDVARQILREGEEQPVAMGAIVLPFVIGAQIVERRLDLHDPDLAALVQRDQIGAAPDGSGNSLMQANPSERSSRAVPRAIASAVSDWRPSGAGTRLIWRAVESIAPD